ncbi:MAG: hypothetical protein CVV08_08400 [Gammaproteobacteria bacterium HGW-Gammaproteobacteria-12]|nr:MAG: hypothetical protein CVV08_08400 [Gammaproteobacteria bacterium HGW-Gammaproteobacteria-12]
MRNNRPGNRLLKNVGEAGKTRQKRPKKRSLRAVNEHFEAGFNAVLPTQVVFRQPGKAFVTSARLFHNATVGTFCADRARHPP